jgi:hypothetical protein
MRKYGKQTRMQVTHNTYSRQPNYLAAYIHGKTEWPTTWDLSLSRKQNVTTGYQYQAIKSNQPAEPCIARTVQLFQQVVARTRSLWSPGLLSNDHGTRRRRRQGISRFTASARESDRKYIRILFQPTYAASFLRYSLDLLPLHVTPATRKLSLERNVRTSTSLSQEVETCVLPISEHAGLDTIWWFHFRPYV